MSVVKSQLVQDPFGGGEAVPGATITYTITLDVLGGGTATASVLRDPIPTFTTYVADTILLNGTPLTDAVDADAGEFDTSGVPTIVVRLGNVTLADGTQTVEFQVTVDYLESSDERDEKSTDDCGRVGGHRSADGVCQGR